MKKPCPECGGTGVKEEVARYRVPPPGLAIFEKDYVRTDGDLVEEHRTRPCVKCGGTGEVL